MQITHYRCDVHKAIVNIVRNGPRTLESAIFLAVCRHQDTAYLELLALMASSNKIVNGQIQLPLLLLYNATHNGQYLFSFNPRHHEILIEKEITGYDHEEDEWEVMLPISVLSLAMNFAGAMRCSVVRSIVANGWADINREYCLPLLAKWDKSINNQRCHLYPFEEAMVRYDVELMSTMLESGADLSRVYRDFRRAGLCVQGESYNTPLLFIKTAWLEMPQFTQFERFTELMAKAGVDFDIEEPMEYNDWWNRSTGRYKRGLLSQMIWQGSSITCSAALVRLLIHNGLNRFICYYGANATLYRILQAMRNARAPYMDINGLEWHMREVQIMCELDMARRYYREICKWVIRDKPYYIDALKAIIIPFTKAPLSLLQIARLSTRLTMGGVHFLARVERLPLPMPLKEYIIAI